MWFAVAAFVLLAAAGLFLVAPGISESVRADLTAVCFILSWLPLFFIVMTWITPQMVLRVSPQSIAYANTFRRQRRWRAKWSEIRAPPVEAIKNGVRDARRNSQAQRAVPR